MGCPPIAADLPAAYRISAGAREARARTLEGGGRATSAAAFAVGLVDERTSIRLRQSIDILATSSTECARLRWTTIGIDSSWFLPSFVGLDLAGEIGTFFSLTTGCS